MELREYIQKDERARKLFRLLPQSELEHFKMQTFKKGEKLISMGEFGNALYIIMSGICNMERNTEVNCRQPQPPLGYLDTVGLYEIVHNVPRLGNVLACNNCCVAALDRKTALRWVDQYPRFMLELSTGIIQRLFKEIDNIDQYAKLPAYYGVVSFLLSSCEMLRRDARRSKGPVKIIYTRQHIADMTGKDIRSVNRIVEQLKTQGYVTIIKGKLHINEEQQRLLAQEKIKVSGVDDINKNISNTF